MTTQEIPLNKLKLSPLNMRQGEVDCADLVASFRSVGVLQNLRVTQEHAEGGKPTGFYLVHVGGRRYRAALQMVEAKVWKKTQPIPCVVCADEATAIEESIAENTQRLDPHPAQRFLAFKALADQGRTPAEIAERFGRSELMVRRSLKLAVVSPRLFELFARDEIKFDQMMAFTLTDDHAAQEAAYFDQPAHSRWAHDIKRRLTHGEVSTSNNPLAAFVGLEAYQAAGGVVRQDLFADKDGEGFISDVDLLHRLAMDRLEEAAMAVRAEGWKWVEVIPEVSYSYESDHSRVYPAPVARAALTADEQDELEAAQSDLEAMCEEYGETEEGEEEIARLEARIAELEGDGERAFTADQLAIAGALVTVNRNGIHILRGLVKPGADTKALKAMQRAAEQSGQGEGAVGSLSGNAPKTRADGLSAALAENLTAHRTLALQAALQGNPRVALVATVHQLLNLTLYKQPYGGTAKTAVVLSGTDYHTNVFSFGDELASSRAAGVLDTARERWASELPADVADLWAYLLASSDSTLAELLAFAVSRQLFAVNQGSADSRERIVHADRMAGTLGLDMADYWTPDAAFFSRIPKGEILKAMHEGADVEPSAELEKLKKGELAVRAESILQGKRWVPEIMRTSPVVAAEATAVRTLAMAETDDDADPNQLDDEFNEAA